MEKYISSFTRRNVNTAEKDYSKFKEASVLLFREIKYFNFTLSNMDDRDELISFFKNNERKIYKKIKEIYQLHYKYFLNKRTGLISLKNETELANRYLNKVNEIKLVKDLESLFNTEIILNEENYKSIINNDPIVKKKGHICKELLGRNKLEAKERDHAKILDLVINSANIDKENLQFDLTLDEDIADIKNIILNEIRYNETIMMQDTAEVKLRYNKYKKFIIENEEIISYYKLDSSIFYKLEKILESLEFDDKKIISSIGFNSLIIEDNLRELLATIAAQLKNRAVDTSNIDKMRNKIIYIYFLIKVIHLQGLLLGSVYRLVLKAQKINLNLLGKLELIKFSGMSKDIK